MAVFLIKLIFLTLSTLLNLVIRLIFTLTAYSLVLVIQAFKLPGHAVRGALEQLGELVKASLGFVAELLMEAIKTLISTMVEKFVQGILESAGVMGSGIGELMDKTRTSLDGLLEDVPEIVEGLSEMVMKVAMDLWNNYKDALGYVVENV